MTTALKRILKVEPDGAYCREGLAPGTLQAARRFSGALTGESCGPRR